MGFSPAEVDAMSLWQFRAAHAGWLAAQGVKMRVAGSDGELRDAEELLDKALAAGPLTN